MIRSELIVVLRRPSVEHKVGGGESVTLTPLIAYDTSRESTISGVAIETFSTMQILSVQCDPLTAWKSLRFFEKVELLSSGSGNLHLSMGGMLDGEELLLDSFDEVIETMAVSLGDIYPPEEDIVTIWDNLPSGRVRMDFGFKLKRAMHEGSLKLSYAVISRIGQFEKRHGATSC